MDKVSSRKIFGGESIYKLHSMKHIVTFRRVLLLLTALVSSGAWLKLALSLLCMQYPTHDVMIQSIALGGGGGREIGGS